MERLLAAHARVGCFLERPVSGLTEIDPMACAGPDDEDDHDELAGDRNPECLTPGFLSPPSRPNSLGRIGGYEVLAVIGNGGMGTVMRAYEEALQRVVAIKALSPELAAISAARRRFVREARAAASVVHEHVVPIYAVEETGPTPYLVMAFVDGRTLQQKLDQGGPPPIAEVVRIGAQVADGLGAAHAQGLIHRDVKPANILLQGRTEQVKITDFGVARGVDDPGQTHPGLIVGTPAYMSPEQANGTRLDQRSDLFSLGSLLYAMCTGHPPFQGTTMLAVLKQLCEETPRPVREINPEVPVWLSDLIASLQARDPADRPQTAAEVIEALGRDRTKSQAPTGVLAPPGSRRDRPALPFLRRIRPRWMIVIAATLVLGTVLAAAETNGVTNVRGTVIQFLSKEGTLVVEVDDPEISVRLDDSDLVITGGGVRELRLAAGTHAVEAEKDGKVLRTILVKITRNGRQVVRVSREPTRTDQDAALTPDPQTDWERSVASLPLHQRNRAVIARLKELNPGLNDPLYHQDLDIIITSPALRDISPLRAMPGLQGIHLDAPNLSDISPLRGLKLARVDLFHTQVSDLSPLQGQPLSNLDLSGSTRVIDLSPLRGMDLQILTIAQTGVIDLSPIEDSKLRLLNCDTSAVVDLTPIHRVPLRTLLIQNTRVSDLSPIRQMPLTELRLKNSSVTDLSPIAGLPLEDVTGDFIASRDAAILHAIPTLKRINERPSAEFWDVGEPR